MESPVRIKSGAAVLLAVCVFLEICNGYPNNQKSNELISSNEPTDSETTTLFVQPQNRPVFSTPRYGPRNSTWKFTRKDSVTPIHFITPTPTQGQINITTLRNEAPTYKTDLPDSTAATTITFNNKIRSRGSVKFGTTRQPFKPKVPHRTMTTLKPEPIETTRPSFIPTNPVVYKDKLDTTTKQVIETKKEKLNNLDSIPRYTRRNSTRLRGEASNKSSVNVTTTLPTTLQKIKERYTTTTRRPIEVKKEILSNTILQPRFSRRNTTRLRVEATEKSSVETFKPKATTTTTRVPEVLIATANYTTTTIKPSEKASESLNSIEVAFDNKSFHEKSVNRSDNIKSIDIGSFEIDKYTSDEFHDVNNVYSHSISPEIEHYIIPENVSDYYVSVGSGSYPQHADNYIHTKSPTSSITGPHLDFFDQQFKEVSESIKQTLDQADYENEQLSTENTEVDPVNFDDLLAEARNNNTLVSYKNTKEIILNDSKDPLHRSSVHANGKNIYYEKSVLSTESYNLTPSTEVPTAADVPKVKEETSSPPTTPSESNRVEQFVQADNRVQKTEPTSTRRIDFFKNNGTRREFLTTIRMRAHTTPKPRIRISLKTNKNLQNTTAPADKAEDASTVKSPEIVKMFPFSRRRTTLTTVSSNLDPVQQELSSPTRVVDPTKSDQDNSIPTLHKRGSVDSTNNVSVKDNDISSQYTIPPTAWALITLRDAPGSKKTNGPNTSEPLVPLQADNAIKTEDELQKLDKHSDSSVQSNNPAISITYTSNNETPPKTTEANKLNSIPITGPSNSIIGPNDGFNKSEDSYKTDTKKNLIPDNDQGYSSYESITKLPSDVTTPVYDKIPESVTSVNFMSVDYFGTGSTNGSSDDDEDAETLSYELNTEANEETNDYNSGSISNSNLEMTTMNHIPLAELFTFPTENAYTETTTQYLTTTETVPTTKDKASTTGDIQEMSSTQVTEDHPFTSTLETPVSSDETNTIISKKYVTLASTLDSTDKDTKTYSDDTSDDYPQSTTNPTTLKSFESTRVPYRFRVKTTTMPDDDLDDFSFTTMYSSTPESEITTTVSPKIPTEHSNVADVTTAEIKSSSEDIEAASTMYYGTTRANTGDLSTTTFSQTTNGYVTGRPTTFRIPDTESSTLFVTQNSPDSREGKHKIIIDDEDKTANTVNSSDQNNADDWLDPNVDIKSIDTYEITNRNNNKTAPENDSSENDTDFNGSEIDAPTIVRNETQPNETQPEVTVTEKTNIEIIKPNLSDGMANEKEDEMETTPGYGQDMKFDTEDGTGAVAAITISVIGVVALLLLIILLMVARGRRTGGGYGQRCTPVSLDSYSLDNVSVNGSTRRKARRPSKRSYGNPAYDESGATSHPMQFAALTNFSLDQESIVSEFNEIPVITVRADEIPPGCESKNRFSNVIPLPETRVSLKPIAGDETSDYINANYVRGPKNLKNYYIACQAPMASTVTDFWRMIWEQNSRVILMLTEFMENGVEKCFEYIPPSEVSDNKRMFGDYKILVKKREIRDKYIISQLQLKNLNTRTWREVTHIWYFWPAKGVPEECHSIIAFLIEARSYLKASQNAKEFDEDGHDSMLTYNGSSLATNQTQISIDPDESNNSNEDSEVNVYNVQRGEKSKNGAVKNGTLTLGDGSRGGPLVVHCSPGTGRTGAVIACDIGIRDFEMVRTVDVPKTVYRIRRDRANSVQTKDQYIFIYKVLSEYATKLTGGVLDSI